MGNKEQTENVKEQAEDVQQKWSWVYKVVWMNLSNPFLHILIWQGGWGWHLKIEKVEREESRGKEE